MHLADRPELVLAQVQVLDQEVAAARPAPEQPPDRLQRFGLDDASLGEWRGLPPAGAGMEWPGAFPPVRCSSGVVLGRAGSPGFKSACSGRRYHEAETRGPLVDLPSARANG